MSQHLKSIFSLKLSIDFNSRIFSTFSKILWKLFFWKLIFLQLNFNLSKIGKEIELMREVIQLEDNPFETLLPIMNQLGPPNVPKASFIGYS